MFAIDIKGRNRIVNHNQIIFIRRRFYRFKRVGDLYFCARKVFFYNFSQAPLISHTSRLAINFK
jgi:hypothetical protein